METVVLVNLGYKTNSNTGLENVYVNNEVEQASRIGLYRCLCDPTKRTGEPSHEKDCAFLKAAQKHNITSYNKLYGVVGFDGEKSMVTWKDFLQDHFKITMDPTYDFVVQFDNGLLVDCNETITCLQELGGPIERYTLARIYKSCKNKNSHCTRPLKDVLKDLHKIYKAKNETIPTNYIVFVSKDFTGYKIVSSLDFSKLEDN